MDKVFARIAAAVARDDLVWHQDLAAAGGSCAALRWCGGRHEVTHLTVTHVRPVVTVRRPDRSPVLAVSVRQADEVAPPARRAACPRIWGPVVQLDHAGDQDVRLSLREADALAEFVGRRELLHEALRAAVELATA